jgi:excisionase family DNA binding protein
MTKNDTSRIERALLTTEEVMAILRVNTRTIYRLIRTRDIPAVRVGRQWRFRRNELEGWLTRDRRPDS